jgi:hypothetical protein
MNCSLQHSTSEKCTTETIHNSTTTLENCGICEQIQKHCYRIIKWRKRIARIEKLGEDEDFRSMIVTGLERIEKSKCSIGELHCQRNRNDFDGSDTSEVSIVPDSKVLVEALSQEERDVVVEMYAESYVKWREAVLSFEYAQSFKAEVEDVLSYLEEC